MKTLLVAACGLALSLPALAGTPVVMAGDGKKTVIEPCPPVNRITFDLSSSYVFSSDFEGRHDASGDAWSTGVDFGYRIPLGQAWPNEQCGSWNLRLGAHYDRHDFGNDGGLPLPNHIQTASAVIALEYIVSGQTGIILESRPGFYFENDISSDTFDAPTFLAIAHRCSDSFVAVYGAAYGRFREYSILPVLGFVWTVNDRVTVSAIYPTAKISFKSSENLQFYVVGEYVGDSVRVDDVKGRPSKLDNAELSYSEYRGGVGVEFHSGSISGELGAGWAFQREFDYHRAGKSYQTDEGAPYIKAELHAAF